jgi:hypothetical protein
MFEEKWRNGEREGHALREEVVVQASPKQLSAGSLNLSDQDKTDLSEFFKSLHSTENGQGQRVVCDIGLAKVSNDLCLVFGELGLFAAPACSNFSTAPRWSVLLTMRDSPFLPPISKL